MHLLKILFYICLRIKTNAMTTESKKLYWVLGDTQKGFRIVGKRPRTKFVPEPFDNLENAKRWMAMEFLLRD